MIRKIPETEQIELEAQTKKLRGILGFGDSAPIGSELPLMLQKLGIILLEYPVQRKGSNSFCAFFCRTRIDGEEMLFLGVNTGDYYDRQLFAIAHELYHYLYPAQPHISREEAAEDPVEQHADWFAAELMLPLSALKMQIVESFGKTKLSDVSYMRLLRFIARVQCTWWMPYKSIVHRLYEADSIDAVTYEKLYGLDEREDAVYDKIGKATSYETFCRLNEKTERAGTDSANLEDCLRNYEEGIVSEEELFDGLQLFNRSPEDFGISFLAVEDEEESGGDGNGG